MKKLSVSQHVIYCILTFILFPVSGFSQINFTASTTSGCSPLQVNFTPVATGAVSYFWDLGNGTQSGLQNPGATYINAGTYTVSLTATFADGSSQTISKPGYITILANPMADFSAPVLNICQGESIQFTDLSTPGSNPITSWLWDFGDGDTSVLSSPHHTFDVPGTFPITLVVTDVFGCDDILVKPAYILVNPTPSADFSVDNALGCTAPHNVNFTSFSNGPNLTHQWNLGNSSTPSTPNPSTTYNSPGSYTVTHIVTDTLGCSDTVVKVDLISVGQNAVNIQASDYLVCPSQNVSFFCNAAIGSSVTWNFGVPGATSNACNPIYAYTTPGVYIVTATITDGSGCTFTGVAQITVSTPPVVDFSVSDTLFCDSPFNVSFTNNTSGAVSYIWQFGDGAGSTFTNPVHTYPVLPVVSPTGQPYYYDITLIATNADGCVSALTVPQMITTGQTGAALLAIPREGCAPLDVQFLGLSYSTSPIISYLWDFGNGLTDTIINPVTTYQDTGHYDVTLIIETLHGCKDTFMVEDYIEAGEQPIADFIADTTYSCASGYIQFINLSQNADSVQWFFSDGGGTSQWEPLYQFTDTGYMDVMLIAFDRGCPDTLIKSDYIYIDPPIAQFTPFFPIICEIPADMQFTDFSIGAHHWHWDFGTGDTSILQNPSYTFTQEGNFPVTLIVSNDTTGCADTVVSVVSIKTVEAEFAVDTTFGCRPVTVQFSDSSTNGIKWFWNFGDGNIALVQNPSHTYTQTGIYSVGLTVVNSLGCFDDTTYTNLIQVYEPQVDFFVNDPTGCAPYTLTFNNLTTSLAPVTNWNWNFGVPGATSNAQSPTFTYTNPGPYTVTLTATDSIGCTDSKTNPNYIFVTEPIPLFTVDHQVHCTDIPINFTNLSSGFGITGYQWNFGDGSPVSTVQNPSHTYTANGIYNASLTVSDLNGCDSTYSLTITIATPEISFAPDTTFADCPPLLVNFTSFVSSPHTFPSWQWDFGDQSTSVSPNPSHVYAVPGMFDVSVIATTAGGCADTFSLPGLIDIGGPYGSFTFAPQQSCPNTPINFNATGTPNVAVFNWDLGGGNLTTGQNITFSYSNPGIYHPLLIVEDSSGCQVLIQSPDSLQIFPDPTANFSVNAPVLCDSGTVNFLDQSLAPAPLAQWEWDFGDGSVGSALQNPSHNYTQPGSYSVQLIVTTIHGCSDTILQPGVVVVHPSPVADIGVSDSTGCEPLNVNFFDNSPATNAQIQTWFWTFGTPGGTANTQNTATTYHNDGNYLTTLTITDIHGCSGSASQDIIVWPLPEPDFVADDSFGCAPKIVQFTDLTPTAIDWKWNFGDNTPFSNLEDPLHTYMQDGVYSVRLQVWDVNGCTDSLTRPNYINLDHPEADFITSDRVICPGEPVSFTDLSISDTLLTGWLWGFGDNTSSTLQNPSHVYQNAGFYDVTLTVTDVFGCTGTLSLPTYIQVLEDVVPQVPDINFVTVISDAGVQVSFDPYDNFRNDFDRYEIYREDGSGNWTLAYSTTNINETLITDTGLDTRQNVYCYRLQVVNYCETKSEPAASEFHCTVRLNTTAQLDQIELSWTPYTGWSEVIAYEIYRVTGYSTNNITLIATVPGTALNFIDTDMFCYEGHTYRIKAIEDNAETVSWSNIDSNAPIHFGPPNPMHMIRATVEMNSFVLVEWPNVPAGDNLVWVDIEKDDGSGFKRVVRQSVASPVRSYEDQDTRVDLQSYDYRAVVVDTCGDRTPLGRIARSILLSAERIRGKVYLEWNDYVEWQGGVQEYQLEVFDENAIQFVAVANLPGNVTEYVDEKTDLEQASYCYRVTAIEAGGNFTASVSNEACVLIDPLLFFPNAFTPNQDLINDRFTIPGAFIAQFNMEIFNRWGQKIFETENQEDGWDGTSNGVGVPEGVYVFKVKGLGHTGELIQRTGTVTLLR